MSSFSLRSATALALLAVAFRAEAQSGFRIGVSRAVSNNNSDNSGINVGGSQVAGSTFAPQNYNAGSGNRNPISNLPAGGTVTVSVPGGNLTVTGAGTASAPITSSLSGATSQLSSGIVSVTTAGGGTITVTMTPTVGQALAQAISPQATRSVAALDEARLNVANALEASGVNPTSAIAVARALALVSQMQNAQMGTGVVPPGAPPAAPPQADNRARPQQEIPLRKDAGVPPVTPTEPQPTPTPTPTPAPAPGPAIAITASPAVYAAAAVAQMTEAITSFMNEQPNTPLPAPLLAAGLLVRAAAASALPLPPTMR